MYLLAYVESVSVWFWSKERPRNGIFAFNHAKNGTRTKKRKRGEGEGKEGLFPTPSSLFYCNISHTVL